MMIHNALVQHLWKDSPMKLIKETVKIITMMMMQIICNDRYKQTIVALLYICKDEDIMINYVSIHSPYSHEQ